MVVHCDLVDQLFLLLGTVFCINMLWVQMESYPLSLSSVGYADLAHRALSVVLQHCLMPDLGWNAHQLQHHRLPALKKELLEARLAVITPHLNEQNGTGGPVEKEKMKKILQQKLDADEHITDAYEAEKIEEYLSEMTPEEFIPPAQIETITVRIFNNSGQV
jgi:hypothetical protein